MRTIINIFAATGLMFGLMVLFYGLFVYESNPPEYRRVVVLSTTPHAWHTRGTTVVQDLEGNVFFDHDVLGVRGDTLTVDITEWKAR